jgi:hypothetical protein
MVASTRVRSGASLVPRPPLQTAIRVCGVLGLFAAYVAAHLVISWPLQLEQQFAAAPAPAARIAEAAERLAAAAQPPGRPLSAAEREAIGTLRSKSNFEVFNGIPYGTAAYRCSYDDLTGYSWLNAWQKYRQTGALQTAKPRGKAGDVDPDGSLAIALKVFRAMPAEVSVCKAGTEQEVRDAVRTTVLWGAAALLALPWLVSTVRRRRHGFYVGGVASSVAR